MKTERKKTNTNTTTKKTNTKSTKMKLCSLSKKLHPEKNKKTCKCLALSCMDFRFVDDVTHLMNCNGNRNNYDKFILAGASLGYNGIPGYKNWIQSFDQTVELAHKLHKISEITIIDHLNCGAFNLVYKPEELKGDGEFNLHVENLKKAEKTLKEKYPFIKKVNKIIFDEKYKPIVID